MITIFTPTYNRAHTLPKLYDSLKKQSCKSFEWLIVDDGSTDNTKTLVDSWKNENNGFKISYSWKENGGKPRAINYALGYIKTIFVFIIDSDDFLVEDAVEFLVKQADLMLDSDLVGIGVLRGDELRKAYLEPLIPKNSWVDVTNLERERYGFNYDANEMYRVSILKRYPFAEWPGEKFLPEAVSLNRIALDGYKLRWWNKVLVISHYFEDGMTKGAWNLLKNNPMGYAIAYNESLKYPGLSFRKKINTIVQFIVMILISGNWSYLLKSNNLFLTCLLFPVGVVWSIRRFFQFKKI